MKRFLQILAGFLLVLILLLVGLNLWFTDERLREMILPAIRESVGTEVEIGELSITFFRTFPRLGLQMQEFRLPDEQNETVATFDRMIVAVRLFPLLKKEISISRLEIDRPQIFYQVRADSTTNIDFLLSEEESEASESTMTIRIPRLLIRDGSIHYTDIPGEMQVDATGLQTEIGLDFDELIGSELDASLESLSVRKGESRLLDGLSLRLRQTSTVDLEQEIVTISEGSLSIRGFTLDLDGTFREWGSETPSAELRFRSSADNFGELLQLAPPELEEHLQGIESGGKLQLEGEIRGILDGEAIPQFQVTALIEDGFLRSPDLQQPIEGIRTELQADNSELNLRHFSARTAGNLLEASGRVENPLEEDAPFSFLISGDVDLSTVALLYPIDSAGIERLSGMLSVDLDLAGTLDEPEEAQFSGTMSLRDGLLKYSEVPRPIENLNVELDAAREQITIRSASLTALSNRFSLSGNVTAPLSDHPGFDLQAEAELDLGTLREFYPIDEDTLRLRGTLAGSARLRGSTEDPVSALRQASLSLTDGYIEHRLAGQPLEEVTLVATVDGPELRIREAGFRTGSNTLEMNGTVQNWQEEEPLFDLAIRGLATLSDLSEWYSLEPWINQLTGEAEMDLRAQGPAGDPTRIRLDGRMELRDVFADGDSLGLPVSNLEGLLTVRPDAMNLERFTMFYGMSDFTLEGELSRYLGFLEENPDPTPALSGSYHSRMLNLDEMIDWDEESEDEPIHIELPNLTSRVQARIDTLLLFGLPITEIQGEARTTPQDIRIEEASARMLDGTAEGDLLWEVPQPDRTRITFSGELNGVQVDAFFREFPIFGSNSRLEQNLTGAFSATVEYATELNELILPEIGTTEASGSFGMTRARMQGHPIQNQLADWLGAPELRSLALDEWTARFSIHQSVLQLNDLRLTSENIGLELEGTQHLETDEIDFTANLLLPARFRRGLASVLSGQVVDALTREDGIISVPVRITGTMASPGIAPDQGVLENLLRDTVQERGRDLLRGLFNRN